MPGLQAGGKGVAGVGPAVDAGLGLDGEKVAFPGGVAGDQVVVLAAVCVRRQVLAAVLQPAHRTAAVPGQPAQADLFRQQDPLVSEAAADVGRDHANLTLRKTQDLRDAVSHDVRHLGRRPERELIQAAVPCRDDAATLDRDHALPRRANLPGHLDVGALRGGRDVALDGGHQVEVVAELLVQQGGVGLAGVQHVDDGRQLFKVQLDLGRHVFGLRPAGGDAHGDQLADLTNLVTGQRPLLCRLVAGQGGDRDDRPHTVEVVHRVDLPALVRRHADGPYPGMGERASNERHLHHAFEPDVAHELPLAAEVAFIFLSRDGDTDALARHGVSRHFFYSTALTTPLTRFSE